MNHVYSHYVPYPIFQFICHCQIDMLQLVISSALHLLFHFASLVHQLRKARITASQRHQKS